MNNDPLYPNDEDEVYNPLRKNLDGGGHNINNLNELDLSGDGEINGVITINGLPYPPNYTSLPTTRYQEFQFPANLTIYGDGSLNKLFTVYDNTPGSLVNSQLDPLFNNTMTGLNVVMLTIFVNVYQTQTVGGNQGKMGFSLYVNGTALAAYQRGEYLIPPNRGINFGAQCITMTFPITCPVPSPYKLELYAYGGYNYTYTFNQDYFNPGGSQPSTCKALGLR
jgi:hypothetical protein